jgi:diguanylate cyclase
MPDGNNARDSIRYPWGAEQAAEFLRLAIAHMAKHEAPFHPLTYAVWFEYVAGCNDALRREIDHLTENGRKLGDELTRRLYYKHVADLDQQSAERIQGDLQRVLIQVSDSATEADGQVGGFGDRMERLQSTLRDDMPAPDLRRTVDAVRRDSQQMRVALHSLHTKLSQTREEIDVLRTELTRVRTEALTDALTGLLNRRGLDERLQALTGAASAHGAPLSLVLADIDYFKRINDSYGHVFGDRVIRIVGEALRAAVKGRDIVARFGGEEFAVLLIDTPAIGARAAAEQMRDQVSRARIRRLSTEETVGNITVSLGVTAYRPGESVSEFIHRADTALYTSKQAGRNRVTVA